MLCYRCGSDVPDGALKCNNCGAELGSATRAIRIPKGSLKALRQKKVASAEGMPFAVGEDIAGRYEVRSKLGQGPFGVVFKTFDRDLESEVAVKVLRADLFKGDVARARFEEAVRQARRLSHQNIVRLHDSGFDRDHAFVAMQYLEGLNLAKILAMRQSKGEVFPVEEVEPLLEQMVQALEHCHRTGFHGDLKPENVLVSAGTVKLTDSFIFDSVPFTAFLQGHKERSFLAPEVLEDDAAAGARGDIFSLGVLLRGMFGEMLPDRVAEVLDRATNPDEQARFESVTAFQASLQDVLRPEELMELDSDSLELIEPEDDHPVPPVMVGADGHDDDLEILTSAEIATLEAAPPEEDTVSTAVPPALIPEDIATRELPRDEMSALLAGEEEDEAPSTDVVPLAAVAGAAVVASDKDEVDTKVEEAPEVKTAADKPVSKSKPKLTPKPPASPSRSKKGRRNKKKGKKKPIMRPVTPTAGPTAGAEPTAEIAAVKASLGSGAPDIFDVVSKSDAASEDESRKTARVKPLPPMTSPPPTQQTKSRSTLVLILVGIFLLVGIGGVMAWQYNKSNARKNQQTIANFGQDGLPGKKDPDAQKDPAPEAPVVPAEADAGQANEKVAEADVGTEDASPDTAPEAVVEADTGSPDTVEAPKEAVAAVKTDDKVDDKPDDKKKPEEAKKEPVPTEVAKVDPPKEDPPKDDKKAETPSAAEQAALDKKAKEQEEAARILNDGKKGINDFLSVYISFREAKLKPEDKAPAEVKGKPTCKRGMVLVKNRKNAWDPFCVDRYEYPGGGRVPARGVTWFSADQTCKGQGKRLCKLREWQRGCGGKYPWGRKWNPNKCNTEDKDELERSVAAAGSFKGCKSRGIYDMVGNVGEWTAEQRVAGGDARSGPKAATCFYASKKSPGSGSPFVGFRCCSDPTFK